MGKGSLVLAILLVLLGSGIGGVQNNTVISGHVFDSDNPLVDVPAESEGVYSVNKTNLALEYVPGELIIRLNLLERGALSKASIDSSINQLNRKYRIISMEKLFLRRKKGLLGVQEIREAAHPYLSDIYKLALPLESDIGEIAREYSRLPEIKYAEPNYIFEATAVPNDEKYSQQWAHQKIQSEPGWDIARGNESVIIAIIDTGVDWHHPDLAANIWNNTDEIADNGADDDGNGFDDDVRGWDFVDIDITEYIKPPYYMNKKEDYNITDNEPMDINGHGTSCSGVAGAVSNNSMGIAGMCWYCKIMPVRAGFDVIYAGFHRGFFESDDIANAITYAADNNASIISMSLGSNEPSSLIKDAIDYAYNKGVTIISAAGNEQSDEPIYPAAYNEVISVAATEEDDKKADFSNFGFHIDIAAPGVGIYSTSPNNSYKSSDGTSFSVSYVAGLAGLILSGNPNLTRDSVRQVLRSSADPVISIGYIGTGRINAQRALQIDSVPLANITYPLNNEFLQGAVEIRGTAGGSSFQNYIVKYGMGIYPENWTLLINSTIQVVNNTLAVLNTSEISDGTYKIKLAVKSADGWTEDERIVIVVNNNNTCYSCLDCSYKLSFPGANITLAGNIAYSGTCIRIGANNVTLDCKGHNITGDYSKSFTGLNMENVSSNTIKNCNIMDYDYTAKLYNSSYNRIFNINSNALKGFLVRNSSYNELFNASILADDIYTRLYLPAFFLSNYSHNNTVFDSEVSGLQLNNRLDGLFIGYSSYDNIVFNTNFSYAPLRIESGNNMILNNTLLYGSHIFLDSGASYNTISGNDIVESGGHAGINIPYGCSHNTISENKIIGGLSEGIHISGKYNKVFSNNILNNQKEGIKIFSSENNTIYNNKILGNEVGIYLGGIGEGSYNNILTHNNVSNNTRGFYLYRSRISSLDNQIKYNNIYNNTDYNFYNDQPNNTTAEYNWWGTVNETEIAMKIYDYYIDNRKGIVDFNPWLTEPVGNVLEGDVNYDCRVNIFDLAAVGLAYGSQPGDLNWNENADITGDGKVDIFDLATVGLNYGQSC